jgi:hypothetical protein
MHSPSFAGVATPASATIESMKSNFMLQAGAVLALSTCSALAEQLPYELQADLRVLAAKVPSYKVDGVSPRAAIEHLVFLVEGHKDSVPVSFFASDTIRMSDKEEAKLNTITLDLKDVLGQDVIRYVAELVGCRFAVKGYTIQEITFNSEGRCRELLYSSSVPLSHKVAQQLGITKGMKSADIMKVLFVYGVTFNEWGGVWWNADSGYLAYKGESSTILRGLVELSNNGWVLSKPSKP